MKKFIALVLSVGACVCLLAGCGEDSASMAETVETTETASSDVSASLVASTQSDETTAMLDDDNGVVTDSDGIIGNEDNESR